MESNGAATEATQARVGVYEQADPTHYSNLSSNEQSRVVLDRQL